MKLNMNFRLPVHMVIKFCQKQRLKIYLKGELKCFVKNVEKELKIRR